MSCNYAEGLSPYENKGKCGLPEKCDPPEIVQQKVHDLAIMIQKAGHVVFHTGAGVSTSAGIPDFRGPKGVWTLEKKGLKPEINVSWDDARPTITHQALTCLQDAGYVQYVITQNIDGLHLKSGFPRSKMSELHGNMFIHQCNCCKRQFVRHSAVPTVGEKCLNIPCLGTGKAGRGCRGKLHDIILDWEGSLPEEDLQLAEMHSEVADLSICLGTTLQIIPSGNLPTWTKKHGGKLVICNLQPTKHDKKGDLIINAYVDDVMIQLCKILGVEIKAYDETNDPTKLASLDEKLIEWTIPQSSLKDALLKKKVKDIRVKVKTVKQDVKKGVKRSKDTNGHTAKKLTKSSELSEDCSTTLSSDLNIYGISLQRTDVTKGSSGNGGNFPCKTTQDSSGSGMVTVDVSVRESKDVAEKNNSANGVSVSSEVVVIPSDKVECECSISAPIEGEAVQ